MPHMHLRGKDFQYRLVVSTGESEIILNVPRFDFKLAALLLPGNAEIAAERNAIECTAHFDNSANHPGNPDPAAEVRWGDQSWEEMMIGWFDLAVEAGANPRSVYSRITQASARDSPSPR